MAPSNPPLDSATLKQRILELKTEIKDLIPAHSRYDDDLYLLLWLRGHNFEVKQTEKKIRSVQKWRDDFGIDKLLDEEPDSLCVQHYALHRCTSRNGRPVLYSDTSKIDFFKVFSEVPVERQERFMLKTFAEMEREMIEANRRNFDGNLTIDSASGVFLLAEAKSVPIRAILTPKIGGTYIGICRQLATYFPGTLQFYYVMNAPLALNVILKAIAKVMSGPYFSMESFSGQKAIEDNVYSQIDPEVLKTP